MTTVTVTTKDIAAALKTTEQTVRNWVDSGKLPKPVRVAQGRGRPAMTWEINKLPSVITAGGKKVILREVVFDYLIGVTNDGSGNRSEGNVNRPGRRSGTQADGIPDERVAARGGRSGRRQPDGSALALVPAGAGKHSAVACPVRNEYLHDAACPTVWRIVEEPEDLDTRADRDGKINKMGYKPSLKYITETYGGEWVENAAAQNVAVAPPNASGQGDAAFAEDEDLPVSPTADEEDALASATDGYWDDIINQLRRLVESADDLPDLQQHVVTSFAELDSDDLVNVMAAAFALAELKGMMDVQDA